MSILCMIICFFCTKSTMYPVSAEETYTSASKKVTLRATKNNCINTNLVRVLCGYHIQFSQQNSTKNSLALSGLKYITQYIDVTMNSNN